jgi:hypothetical protein
VGGGGETGCGGLGTGGVSNIGRDGNKDLRCMNKGICFSTGAETAGTGGKQDGDLAGRGKDAGEGQAAVDRASAVKLRGGDSTVDGWLDEGAMSMFDGVSGGRGHMSGVSMRVDTGEGRGVSSEAEGTPAAWLRGGDSASAARECWGRGRGPQGTAMWPHMDKEGGADNAMG